MKGKKIIELALATALATGLTSPAMAADKDDMEKCAGIVKAGMNDCGTSKHACAGQSTTDNAAGEWVFLPKGTCGKITGGTVVSKK